MTEARWILGCVLLALATWPIAMNGTIFVQEVVLRRRAPSWTPLVGGATGALALLLIPSPLLNRLWWVPLVIDWGSAPGLLFTAFWHLSRVAEARGWRQTGPLRRADLRGPCSVDMIAPAGTNISETIETVLSAMPEVHVEDDALLSPADEDTIFIRRDGQRMWLRAGPQENRRSISVGAGPLDQNYDLFCDLCRALEEAGFRATSDVVARAESLLGRQA